MTKLNSNWVINLGAGDPAITLPGVDTYTPVEGVKSLEGPGSTNPSTDVSDNDSRGQRDFISGLADGGSLSLSGEVSYTSGGDLVPGLVLLRALGDNGVPRNIQIQFVNRVNESVLETYDVVAFVSEFKLSGEAPDGVTNYSASLKLTGAGTWS